MAWLQIHQSLKEHRKEYAVADHLDIELPHAMGLIISFWLWALDNAPTGSLGSISNRMIARAARWNGNSDDLVDAFKSAELLDENEDGELEIHDWNDYAGTLIERRESERQRSRDRRAAAKKSKADSSGEEERPPDNHEPTAGQTAGRPPDRPQDDHEPTGGRVEKSRVEKSRVDVIVGDRSPTPPSAHADRFERFWQLYPRKVGKGAAKKSWNRIKPNAELFEIIMRKVSMAIQSEQWQKEGGRYIPNPATWLNQERWNDELPALGAFPRPPTQNGKPNTMDVLAGIIKAAEGSDEI